MELSVAVENGQITNTGDTADTELEQDASLDGDDIDDIHRPAGELQSAQPPADRYDFVL